MYKSASIALTVLLFISTTMYADNKAPWGHGKLTATEYRPQKVVYDVTTGKPELMDHVLDRASYLSKITGADPFDSSIILVLHGSEIDFFAIKNYQKYKELMQRTQSLVESEVLQIRMCRIAAQGHGYEPGDIHGFVNMVPMGDAEIIRLQNEEGHAYMR